MLSLSEKPSYGKLSLFPGVAGLPFLSVTCHGFRISRLNLHFRQYASIDTLQGLDCAQFTTSQGDSEIGRDEADRISVAAKRKWLVQKHSGGLWICQKGTVRKSNTLSEFGASVRAWARVPQQ